MNISHYIEEKILLVKFNEELDHHAQENIKRRIDYEIQRFMPKKLVFDFGKVNFMDSAGIGLIIGRYKLAKIYGGQVDVINMNEKIKKICDMAGIFKIINLVEQYDGEILRRI